MGACCWWRSWLRHCSTSQKVAGSIPDCVIVILHWHKPSGRTMTLGSTQPLTEMSTRNIYWDKGGRCVRLTTLPPSCAIVLKSRSLILLEPSGSVQACNGIVLSLPLPLPFRYDRSERLSSLVLNSAIINISGPKKQKALSTFYHIWENVIFIRISSSLRCRCLSIQILSQGSWTKN